MKKHVFAFELENGRNNEVRRFVNYVNGTISKNRGFKKNTSYKRKKPDTLHSTEDTEHDTTNITSPKNNQSEPTKKTHGEDTEDDDDVEILSDPDDIPVQNQEQILKSYNNRLAKYQSKTGYDVGYIDTLIHFISQNKNILDDNILANFPELFVEIKTPSIISKYTMVRTIFLISLESNENHSGKQNTQLLDTLFHPNFLQYYKVHMPDSTCFKFAYYVLRDIYSSLEQPDLTFWKKMGIKHDQRYLLHEHQNRLNQVLLTSNPRVLLINFTFHNSPNGHTFLLVRIPEDESHWYIFQSDLNNYTFQNAMKCFQVRGIEDAIQIPNQTAVDVLCSKQKIPNETYIRMFWTNKTEQLDYIYWITFPF